jgi:hypothetical protein
MEKNQKLYIVSCAKWQTLASGRDSEEAATNGFEKMLKLKGENLEISPIIDTICFSDMEEDMELEQYREMVYCPKVMANAGYHETAKSFSSIINKANNKNEKD